MQDKDPVHPNDRPADVCRALLAALDAADGRRHSRKRDQTPDAIGLAIKRDLLARAVRDDPAPEHFEAWLLEYASTTNTPERSGAAQAMARAVFDEWRLAQVSSEFHEWLHAGAPSDDARTTGHRTQERRNRLDAAAVVLAGGRSARMGRPKALLPFDDQPLIVHVVESLRQLCAEVVVVAAPEQELPEVPATIVHDAVAYQGPVGGLCYGLSATAHALSFVTSCDSPFLNHDLIAYLVSQAAEYDVVVPYWDGRPQPLHAVYRRDVVQALEEQLSKGELRPIQLFDRVRTLRVDEPRIARLDPEGWSFFNMNTPEEYERALVHWRAQTAR